jgi:glycerophosphoryl diester phosphodiesterase/HEAT repeat protein
VDRIRQTCAALIFLIAATAANAGELQRGQVELLCHRTANEDVPENTLESLEQAALMGCNVVEIDLRRTLDGEIVLNHDGVLERLTDGIGTLESSYYDDLRLRDTGAWMGERFAGMHIAKFEDALQLARKRDIRLMLDIKVKDIEPEVMELVRREGMLDHIRVGGDPTTVWVQPDVTAEQLKAYHGEGKAVVVNFSANQHEMDLAGMKAAVAAGADGLFVDYPRLGADAVGRPVELRLNTLADQARVGESHARSMAILELSRSRGFELEASFAHWLLDADDQVSRAAAVALVTARPKTGPAVFDEALQSQHADARANAAWALGVMGAPASTLLPLLKDKDPRVLQETLMALARMPGKLDAQTLLPLLAHPEPAVRGAAALALARHQPDVALRAIPAQLQLELQATKRLDEDYIRRGKPQLSQSEIDEITGYFRCEMKMVQAISMLKGTEAMRTLEELAFQPALEFTQMFGQVTAFQLWDRIGTDARSAVQALGSHDTQVADRAEWMLVQGGPGVLPEVRKALDSKDAEVRKRAIHVLAWQGDTQSLAVLQAMRKSDSSNDDLIAWAIDKIDSLHAAR